MLAFRPLYLVCAALQRLRPVQWLGDVDHLCPLVGFRSRLFGCRDAQYRARDLVGTIGRASLAPLVPGGHVHGPEILECNIAGTVDRLGNRTVDPLLGRRLHADMVFRTQGLGIDEMPGQRPVAEHVTPEPDRVVDNLFLDLRAVRLQHLAVVRKRKHRFDSRGNIARIQ